MRSRTEELIELLQLQPHPEGGFYRQVFKSARAIDDRHKAMTAIHFLLPQGAHSKWHRVSSDEIWVSLEGAGVRLYTFDGDTVASLLVHGHAFHAVAPDVWQAAEPLGEFALVACFVAPGFEFEDFVMMETDVAAAAALRSAAPELAALI